MSNQTKQRIQQALQPFAHGDLRAHSLRLLETLGYQSERQLALDPAPAAFLDALDRDGAFRRDKALFDHWASVHLLCQITDADIRQANQLILLDSAGKIIDNAIIESYLFIALDLRERSYTRTQLAHITREVNRLFAMPALILFRHGQTLTLSIINRRLHKREQSKDVLEKVTLIKDVRCANPHRAHLEILDDLSLDELYRVHQFANFVELHKAWQTTLDSSELNKKFFREIANWYFWAVNEVTFPTDAGPADTRSATSIIRLLTRLIFVWFLKEKGVIPDELFNRRALDGLLTGDDPQESAFYKAILQNLFFATLNQEMNTPQKPDNRKFRGEGRQHYGITNLYRYKRYFTNPDTALGLFSRIPFLNGGLFECLDKPDEGIRIDGFSDRADNPLRVPDDLFFGDEREVDLNAIYDTKGKKYKVRGLIHTLNQYKFTIAENTPIEEEIALDPELLGKVFENLLAAYNPETGTTARKQTGSFYTPREIVNYMVDESLLAYLARSSRFSGATAEAVTTNDLEERLRHLFAYNEEPHQFNQAEVAALIAAIDQVNILDPACGSGAFPMGILHKLVFILGKLDPNNEQWKQQQRQKALADTEEAFHLGDRQEREERLLQINDVFERNSSDYGRKLYLIENCIYGVDIQPVAVQIAKLRFFISLVVDQRLDATAPNRGILPLPNLETKFVAANTLLGIEKPQQLALRNPAITAKEKDLAAVRSKHFRARTPRTKAKWRAEDKRLRAEIGDLLQQEGMLRNEDVARLAAWDPYNQNANADFFDAEWMFGLTAGFDVVIGNPPYFVYEGHSSQEIPALRMVTLYKPAFNGKLNAYKLFLVQSLNLCRPDGFVTEIFQNSFLADNSAKGVRDLFFKESTILVIDSFPERDDANKRVFRGVKMSVCILLARKSRQDSYPFTLNVWNEKEMLEGFSTRFSKAEIYQYDPNYFAIPYLREKEKNLFTKFYNNDPLSRYFRCYQGELNMTTHRKYFSQIPTKHMVLKGAQIQRYLVLTDHMSQGEIEYVKVEDYLKSFSTDKSRHYQKDRVVMQGITGVNEPVRLKASYVLSGNFCAHSCNYLISLNDQNIYSNWAILALINSKLFNWIYKKTSTNSNVNSYEIHNLTVPAPYNTKRLDELAQQISETKKSDPTADVFALEREIDELVYALYNLTPAEIALIEGREDVRSNRFSGAEAAEAATTNAEVGSNRFSGAAPPLLFIGQPPQGSFGEKRARLDKLTKEATPAALQSLVAALADDNATIRWQAAAALKSIGGPQVAAALGAFLAHTQNPAAKAEAAQLLAALS